MRVSALRLDRASVAAAAQLSAVVQLPRHSHAAAAARCCCRVRTLPSFAGVTCAHCLVCERHRHVRASTTGRRCQQQHCRGVCAPCTHTWRATSSRMATTRLVQARGWLRAVLHVLVARCAVWRTRHRNRDAEPCRAASLCVWVSTRRSSSSPVFRGASACCQ